MKAENHSGVTHINLIPIWEYSNNVFQKLLTIYVTENFTLSPLEACIFPFRSMYIFYLIFGPFRQFPIVNLRVTPLWFSNFHIYLQSLHTDSSDILQQNHTTNNLSINLVNSS